MSLTRTQLRFAVRRKLKEVTRFYEQQTGSVTVVLSSPLAVAGASTEFLTDYEVGNEIKIETELREIVDIASNTALTVGRAFAAAHTTVAHSRLDDRTWTDEELDETIDESVADLGNALWAGAPDALDGPVTMNLTAGTCIVTIPTSVRSFHLVEVLAVAGGPYLALMEIASYYKDDRRWNWPYYYGAVTPAPTGIPTGFIVISPTQIELNAKPVATIANGLRFYGPHTLALGTGDTATLDLPDADTAGWDRILVNWATAKLCLTDESLPVGRADRFQGLGDRQLAALLARWSIGRSTGPQTIRITHL